MFVVIYEISPERLIYGRRLGPHEKLNPVKFAIDAASIRNRKIDWNRVSFDGRGDLRVEFRNRKLGGYLSESQSYYYIPEVVIDRRYK